MYLGFIRAYLKITVFVKMKIEVDNSVEVKIQSLKRFTKFCECFLKSHSSAP